MMANPHPDMRRGIPGEGRIEWHQDGENQCRIMTLIWDVTDVVSGVKMPEFRDQIIVDDIDLQRRVQGTDEPILKLQHALDTTKRRWQALNQTSGDFILDVHDEVVRGLQA